jgi:DtxR family Mn-dependent transcriptional regulator
MAKESEGMPSEAAQGYLLAIRSMSMFDGTAMTASLGRRMEVSTQAASEMVGRLVADGWVELDAERGLHLTPAGRIVADTVFRRHSLLEWLLTRVVGLGWAESDEEAARLHAALSPTVEARIATLLGDPPTCPHGNPIDAEATRTRPMGSPLSGVAPGETVTILRITEEAEEDAELLVLLERNGLVPGAHATVTAVASGDDRLALTGPAGDCTMTLRSASMIRVLPGHADPALFHRVPSHMERQAQWL